MIFSLSLSLSVCVLTRMHVTRDSEKTAQLSPGLYRQNERSTPHVRATGQLPLQCAINRKDENTLTKTRLNSSSSTA